MSYILSQCSKFIIILTIYAFFCLRSTRLPMSHAFSPSLFRTSLLNIFYMALNIVNVLKKDLHCHREGLSNQI